jgi:hypothetical protein
MKSSLSAKLLQSQERRATESRRDAGQQGKGTSLRKIEAQSEDVLWILSEPPAYIEEVA